MHRPCFLVVDDEFPGTISSRKLVLETAKFNVITAYSSSEAIETLRRFPALDAAVLNGHQRDMPCQELAGHLRALSPQLSIVITSAGERTGSDGMHFVPSFEPERLLATLRKLCIGETLVIDEHETKLHKDHTR